MTLWKWSQSAAANDDIDTSINFQEGQSPASLNNSCRALMAAIAKYRDDVSGNLVTAGTSTAYTLSTNQGLTALTDGFKVRARVNATSGADPTLNVDGLGAKYIVSDVSATKIPSGALVSGQVYSFVYDAAADGWLVANRFGDTRSLATGGTGAALSDPGADRMMFWDDSVGSVAWLAPSTGLAIDGENLKLSHLGLQDLTDPGADRVPFWDDSEGKFDWGVLGDGLETSGTTIRANIASQSEMEAGSATDVLVPIGRQHYHPGHCKAWANIDGTGTVGVTASYNCSSVTDNGGGDYSINFTTSMADAAYCGLGFSPQGSNGSNVTRLAILALAAGSIRVGSLATGAGGGGNVDVDPVCVAVLGDMA